MLVGGSEITPDLLDTFGKLCGGKEASILILPQTLETPSKALPIKETLNEAGFGHVFMSPWPTFTDKDRKALEDRISKAAAIWVPDGDQSLFLKRFGADWCHKAFTKFIERGGTWCGVNAGATLAGDPMFDGETTGPGIGLIDAVVDYDYYAKHREIRLRNAFFGCRVQLGIGLDNGEWLVIRDTIIEKKVGSPQVFLREAG